MGTDADLTSETTVDPKPDRANPLTTGRFAPSPTGALHLGNLRTALVSWCATRVLGGDQGVWSVRMEDLDPETSSRDHEMRQLAHLARLGLRSDRVVLRQSERFDLYRDAIGRLRSLDLVYECFCTRREIRDAAAAPHGGLPDGAYPGTCRDLTIGQRQRRASEGRPAAVRLRTDGERYSFDDLVLGEVCGAVDDVVLQRNDGVPAYNLAVVVDDHLQGVDHVVRGDDLTSTTPRQLHLQRLLGFEHPVYAHVPLVVGPDGERLAKRHGAVTLDDLTARGVDDAHVLEMLARSLGIEGSASDARSIAVGFTFARLPRSPWIFDPDVPPARSVTMNA